MQKNLILMLLLMPVSLVTASQRMIGFMTPDGVEIVADKKDTFIFPHSAWKSFQMLHNLSEDHQRNLLLLLRQTSTAEELLCTTQDVAKNSAALLQGLVQINEGRGNEENGTQDSLTYVERLLATTKPVTQEEIIDILSKLSALSNGNLRTMLNLVTKAPTYDLIGLIGRLEQINRNLTTFIEHIEVLLKEDSGETVKSTSSYNTVV